MEELQIITHQQNDLKIAEVISRDILIKNIDDGKDLAANLYYQGFDNVIIHNKSIAPDFFDLKTKVAGEILQTFSNFRIKLAIVGDFTTYASKSLNDFIFESNKMGRINFVSSIEEAVSKFGQ
ncbi:DUF4180 domain-containing protein [Spirosoma foliorum]|uniref:DUF4180 domain-containing protein n=1 Tax=Spirosoma foliorum TaxID=2710596 RepID=A0A7G5GZG3_9BACT|nr:DUF4180 domain-containing protein [Spirosoma foliorum]QMW04255.1 DUF4180 domain-containing protein [Spirosoma foliorum]